MSYIETLIQQHRQNMAVLELRMFKTPKGSFWREIWYPKQIQKELQKIATIMREDQLARGVRLKRPRPNPKTHEAPTPSGRSFFLSLQIKY